MDNKKRNEMILQTTCDLLEKMNVEVINGFVEDIEGDDNKEENREPVDTVLVSIEVDKPGNLIGIKGRNLNALQTILPLIVKNKLEKWIKIVLDVNNYRAEQKERLIGMVNNLANKVIETKNEIHLAEMSSYERRLCHLAAKSIEGIVSESEGEGEERHVVLKLAVSN